MVWVSKTKFRTVATIHRMPRARGLASPLGRDPLVPPRPPLAVVPPLVLVDGAGTRDWRVPGFGVWNFGVGLDEAGGLSMKDVSVVMNVVSPSISPAVLSV